MAKPAAKSFSAPLERMGSRLNWLIVRIPFDVGKTWGNRGHFRVAGEINGFAFRAALFPDGKGNHFMNVNRKVQAGANAKAGSVVRLRLAPDLAERTIELPPEILRYFKEDRSLRRWFDTALNFSTRKAIADWVAESKNPGVRARRGEQLAERLYQTMDAEHELPPMIRSVLARYPGALPGWNRMTPTQRRGQLLSIFYYRNPESRLRRIEKVAEMAAEVSAKLKQAAGE